MKHELNPDLRYRSTWLIIGYVLICLVVYLSVTSNPLKLDLAFAYQDKVSHALAYFVLMAWFAQIYHTGKQRAYHATGFVLMGIALEGVQSLNPARMAEFADMLANASGVALAMLLARRDAFGHLLAGFERLMHKP